jgi:hypothetical protein
VNEPHAAAAALPMAGVADVERHQPMFLVRLHDIGQAKGVEVNLLLAPSIQMTRHGCGARA